ncbi:genomic island protein [Acidovorax sp. SUPP950]|uniref:portal protein n=1 Tax=Acidovorax sp. SUPP950 TaxID=511901 RepID=UPI0023BC3A30|nr:genomic island protein [Acidovorax sp. SUPP950]GKS73675.1 genomic island protein [Acidovorax sp. SUPP950]
MAMDQAASENWYRYQYGKDRGHIEYTERAALCERMYLGGGEQWSDADKEILRSQGRPFYEFNEVMPSVNSAVGYQIQNRMDIAFKPRGEQGDLQTATILSKVAMQIADRTKLHWVETQVFSDGLIEQRGYYDVRMDFSSNMKGDVDIFGLDPRDVIPDPDAKSYDPDKWGDVIVTRWLSLDEIERLWGRKARDRAEQSGDEGQDFGDMDDEVHRGKFGSDRLAGLFDAFAMGGDRLKRYRIIDRQIAVYESTDCLVYPETGDVAIIANMAQDSIEDALAKGAVRAKRMRRRVKWVVSTYTTTLHEGYSPYDHFTVVPYFAYFRRGKTRGMVDGAIGPQEALNKAVSQYVHIINTSANSGWVVEQNSLTNMDTEELEAVGAKTGLVIEYQKGTTPPEKIQPNQVPSGVDKLIDRATKALKDVTVPEAMRGIGGNDEAGVAIQAKQFASQQQLAVPLDNLAYTRQMLATRILKLIQRYYDSYRVFRITETDPMTGKPKEEVLEINKFDPESGKYLFDVTVGEYDVVITEQPMQVTFENSQFNQALEMRKAGINIPDPTVIRYSNLADKHEILGQMQGAGAPPPDPKAEAEAGLKTAQAEKTQAETDKVRAETVEVRGRTMYSAMQSAQVLQQMPGTAMVADQMLGSQGFEDQDAGPAVAAMTGGLPAEPAPAGLIPENTDPLTPTSPAAGFEAGIETPEADGVLQ